MIAAELRHVALVSGRSNFSWVLYVPLGRLVRPAQERLGPHFFES